MTHFIPTIGLEIHAELNTKSKMFCGCKNDPFCKDPNIYVCPVCLGLPGALPVVNKRAVVATMTIGRALKGEIAKITKWDRKHYFYPDLPKGYQISQFDIPLVRGGYLEVPSRSGGSAGKSQNKIRITRIHLEEDTGKLLHDSKTKSSLVDFNRAGVPLVELVTEPDLHDAKTAADFAREYQLILRTLGVASADMEKGMLRVEANVSVAPGGGKKLGVKVEIKNLNSFKSVEQAIKFEVERQIVLLKKGAKIVQETRGWDAEKGVTVSQRVKETSADYRYFPEPDLPPLRTEKLSIPKLPALPSQVRKEFRKEGVRGEDIDILLKKPKLLERIKRLSRQIESGRLPLKIADLIKALLHDKDLASKEDAALIKLAALSPHKRKMVLSGKEIGESLSEAEITLAAKAILQREQDAVSRYKAGKSGLLGFFVGQVVKETKGRADPRLASRILQELLGG